MTLDGGDEADRADSTEHAPVGADQLRSFAEELERVERQSDAGYVTFEVTNTGATVNLHYNFDMYGEGSE